MTAPPTISPLNQPPADPVQFYEANAELLAARYEALSFEQIHHEVIEYLPCLPALILDVGAGSGRDAAALSKCGYDVVAVEPSSALRHIGQRLHSSPRITWIDDRLPDLQRITGLKLSFDAILCSAVWMHLDRDQQRSAMRRLSELLRPAGRLFLTFRSQTLGDRPGVYEMDAEDIIEDAREAGLHLLSQRASPDVFDRSGVTWSSLYFQADGREPRPTKT